MAISNDIIISKGDPVELRDAHPLRLQFSGEGVPLAVRHEGLLVNQLIPDPWADGLFRLYLREWQGDAPACSKSLVTGNRNFAADVEDAATWTARLGSDLRCGVHVQLHPSLPAWAWTLTVENRGKQSRTVDALLAQDLGLADEAAVRNNEAFTSHYIDLNPVEDPTLGWVVLARQNQPMAEGRHPMLAVACLEGAVGYATDGWQFYGQDHRLTGTPAALEQPQLPSRKLQYECAMACLQSPQLEIAPGQSRRVTFLLRLWPHHPAASSTEDVEGLQALLPADWIHHPEPDFSKRDGVDTLFRTAPWLHGEEPTASDLRDWFPGEHRHLEHDEQGRVLSFFCDRQTHVATRAKEATILRPHGHVLRSGDHTRLDPGHFGLTCYAAGVFGAQAYLGNPNLARLLPVARNALGVNRSNGQRIFVLGADGQWRQLGVPSAFALEPGKVRWIYRLPDARLEVAACCGQDLAAAFLQIRVVEGATLAFLITHRVTAGADEDEAPPAITPEPELGRSTIRPAHDSLLARAYPNACFAIAMGDPTVLDYFDGDEAIRPGARSRAYVTMRTEPTRRCEIILAGSNDGLDSLDTRVKRARAVLLEDCPASAPPAAPLRIRGGTDAGVSRVQEIVPWFNHNASIHFSAPHGLEQYGGAAWGVRDVCQGSLEWLLAVDQTTVARETLRAVFAQQYAGEGGWPQWFMHAPFQFIQQHESHGDVCLWPLKALCDYLERTGDLELLDTPVGYTDPKTFQPTGPQEPLLAHCDRIVHLLEARMAKGTALVDYGDGDWDDTLQPADPALRTRLISAWTVGLAYHTLRLFRDVCQRREDARRVTHLDDLLARMYRDFHQYLVVGGVVAGFLLREDKGGRQLLLHPRDHLTGIRYRLLPMTRSILAELFTPEEAQHHLELIRDELLFEDGVRLMSEPVQYRGGVSHMFKRAETAANIGREIGLMYVHAHLRYAETLAKVGDAVGCWQALQRVNPVALQEVLPQAARRQANVFFSSSDADFADRHEAAAHWDDLKAGKIAVRGGWRLYSSGPGLFLNMLKSSVLGLRPSFGDVVFDPVLPPSLDGLVAEVSLCDRPVAITYRVKVRGFGPTRLEINGTQVHATAREPNPYRPGGLRVPVEILKPLLADDQNRLTIEI
ncbi:MAG: hypothetical protein Q7P63_06875 [Verrucomicrobiota bacterium JB022]|nr:hypothetical protein [Verrucomicrobiota bacterium JB022]